MSKIIEKEVDKYINLFGQILKRTMKDIKRKGDSQNKREGIAWVKSNLKYPGSFVWICDIFETDVNKMRRRML